MPPISIFYILTAPAGHYLLSAPRRKQRLRFVTIGLLPLGAAGFLGWIFVKSLGEAPWSQRWSLIAFVIAGLVLLVVARFVLRTSFFRLLRESEEVARLSGRTIAQKFPGLNACSPKLQAARSSSCAAICMAGGGRPPGW